MTAFEYNLTGHKNEVSIPDDGVVSSSTFWVSRWATGQTCAESSYTWQWISTSISMNLAKEINGNQTRC